MAMLMSDLPPVFPRSTDEVPAKSKGKRRRSTPARASEDSDGDSDESERPQTMQRRATPPAHVSRCNNSSHVFVRRDDAPPPVPVPGSVPGPKSKSKSLPLLSSIDFISQRVLCAWIA
jgi:hypothetical protein